MRILSKVNGSVLWLPKGDSTANNNLKKEAKKNSVDENRIIFASRLTLSEDHLNRIQLADLFLDTTPYNAHTTSSDALRMGLPVLTCIGHSFASRVAASLLNAVNLPELITTNQEEYESLAIELATHPEKLKIIKDKLASNLSTAPLYNTKLFTQNLESAYTMMYERHHQGLDPDHIYVKH
jgi:predicted O-linked N-acetylglucosamine transferase (SPINDLY family)